MEALNLALFGLLGAGFDAHPFWLAVATAVAQKSAWLCVALFAWAAWRTPGERWHVLAVMVSAGAASVLARNLAESVGLPRPFMLGLSPSYIEHGARGALPSTHATVMFTMAFMFLLRPPLRRIGWLLFGVALATSWARVYVGVHFPRDIAAGLLFGGLLALLFDTAWRGLRRVAPSIVLRVARQWPIGAHLSTMVSGDRFSLYFILLFTVAAIGIGLQAPEVFPLSFLQQGGAVEKGTLFFYLAALLTVVTLRLPFVRLADKAATMVVLLACIGREAGLPSPVVGMRMLHAAFGDGDGAAPKLLIVAALAALVLAAAWLLRRYRQGWRFALTQRQWRPAVVTVMVFALVAVFTHTLDSLPEVTASLWGPQQAGFGRLMFSIEEILELALPLLLMLAFFQAGRGKPPSDLPSRPEEREF